MCVCGWGGGGGELNNLNSFLWLVSLMLNSVG